MKPKQPLVLAAAKEEKEPSLPNAVLQHFASAKKLALRDRPIAAVSHLISMLRLQPA